MNEKQTCSSRMNQPGPWRRGEGLDIWLTNRWTTDHAAAEAKRQEFRDQHPNGSISDTAGEWLWKWGPPRTCSFCGGVHPDDAITLVIEGWEVEITGKGYKRYLNPPGTSQKRKALSQSLADGRRLIAPSVWSPTPPVKLYVWHFDDNQIKQFNIHLENNLENLE